jgi:hypothetical protein
MIDKIINKEVLKKNFLFYKLVIYNYFSINIYTIN